jgi:biopolymer transport protein ExbD
MSMSTRARRIAQGHLRHREDAALNLIPLIDILSVMVAFLLVYSADVEVVQNAKGVEIPQSVAEEQPKHSVVVMITKDQLFVQNELITTMAEMRSSGTPLIDALSAALKRPMLAGEDAADELAWREITVLGDKSLPYDVVRRVMATCTDAGYGRISLAVVQKEKPVEAGSLRSAWGVSPRGARTVSSKTS